MRTTRNVAFVAMIGIALWASTQRARTFSNCDAWSYVGCDDCQLLQEEFCDQLCEWQNTGSGQCGDWIYSQGGPQCGYIGPGPDDCAVVCTCAPDEPAPRN